MTFSDLDWKEAARVWFDKILFNILMASTVIIEDTITDSVSVFE